MKKINLDLYYLGFVAAAILVVCVMWLTAVWLSDHANANPADADKQGRILAICGTAIVVVALAINIAFPRENWANMVLFLIVVFVYTTIFSFPNMRIIETLRTSSVDWVEACRHIETNPWAESQDAKVESNPKAEAVVVFQDAKVEANPKNVAVAGPHDEKVEIKVETKAGTAIETKIESQLVADIKKQDYPFKLDDKNRETMVMDIIKAEHTKAVEEIKLRTSIDDQWYNNKFILVGGLFLAFFTYFNNISSKIGRDFEIKEAFGDHVAGRWSVLISDAGNMFKTILPSSILGMACIVSLAIDLHIRSNGTVTRQLGLWIYNYVECVIADTSSSGFLGWEAFLRIDDGNQGIQGMHMDYLTSMLDAVHFYFTSVYLYALYFGCLLFYFAQNKCERREFGVFSFVFWLVHATLAIFSFGGNSFPSALEVQLTLWPKVWLPGDKGGWTPLVICMLVTGLSYMRLYTLYRNCIRDPDGNARAPGAPAHVPVESLGDPHV